MAGEIRIGTSGFHYKHWIGPFYPAKTPAAKMLDFYLRHFDTVELNNSFYRLPTAEAFDAWREATPADFVFAVKASRFITHNKKLKDPEHALDNLLPRAAHLGPKLGPILFQLPPHWRVNPERLSPIEASIRTVESYYPAHVPTSHVLILTSQVELAPSYYHYLLFSLLEYKHSAPALSESGRLLGISLELPTHYLNGSKGFSHPSADNKVSPLFLWQAPNSNAALYFGDKWVEFHSFLSNRFTVQPRSAKESYSKLVSEKHPAWMEYLLELVRARGYAMLYPSFASHEASAIVTVHQDLYQPPEEFLTSTSDSFELDAADSVSAGAILDAHSGTPAELPSAESTTGTTSTILPLLFPNFSPSLDSSDAFLLPRLINLRALSFTGESYSLRDAGSYAEEFAQNYGGCGTNTERIVTSSWSADDLFCLDGQDLRAAKAASAG